MAIFVDGWTIDAAGQVAGLADDRVLICRRRWNAAA
jgi:hypothetical protein